MPTDYRYTRPWGWKGEIGKKKSLKNVSIRKSIGFNAEIAEKHEDDVDRLLQQILPQDLVKFGLIPEIVGRVPVTVALEMLDKDALMKILTEPKNALTKQYQKAVGNWQPLKSHTY